LVCSLSCVEGAADEVGSVLLLMARSGRVGGGPVHARFWRGHCAQLPLLMQLYALDITMRRSARRALDAEALGGLHSADVKRNAELNHTSGFAEIYSSVTCNQGQLSRRGLICSYLTPRLRDPSTPGVRLQPPPDAAHNLSYSMLHAVTQTTLPIYYNGRCAAIHVTAASNAAFTFACSSTPASTSAGQLAWHAVQAAAHGLLIVPPGCTDQPEQAGRSSAGQADSAAWLCSTLLLKSFFCREVRLHPLQTRGVSLQQALQQPRHLPCCWVQPHMIQPRTFGFAPVHCLDKPRPVVPLLCGRLLSAQSCTADDRGTSTAPS